MRSRPFFSTTFYTALGRFAGMLIPFFIALLYGVSPATDAFFFAFGFAFFMINVNSHIFEAASIPYLTEKRSHPEGYSSLANGVLMTSFPVITGITFLVWFFFQKFLTTVWGWEIHSAKLVSTLFLELLPLVLLNVWIAHANGILYTHKIFWVPALSPFIRSVSVILFLFTFHISLGIHAIPLGFVFGETIRAAILGYFLLKMTHWRIHFRDENTAVLRAFFKQATLQIMALLAINSMFVMDQGFASKLETGNLSLLSYAERMMQVPYMLFLGGFLQVFLSYWAQHYSDSADTFWPKTQKDIRRAFYAAVLISGLLLIIGKPLIGFLFHLTHFSEGHAGTLVRIFSFLALGFAPGVVWLLYGRVLFVIKKSGFYCLQAWLALAIKAWLDFYLMQKFGAPGIAMSTMLIYSLMAAWLHFYIKYHRSQVAP